MAALITFERADWCAQAAQGLKRALAKDGAFIAEEVRDGISQLWRVNAGESWVVTREEGAELVVVCLEGKDMVGITGAIIQNAKKAGFETMRAHTKRRGMMRALKRFNVKQREIVLELDL